MANCYKRKNGNYSIRVSNGRPDGKQKFVITTYRPPKELSAREAEKAAREFAEIFEMSVRNGTYVQGKAKTKIDVDLLGITLNRFVEEYYYNRVKLYLSPNTFSFYRSVTEQIILPSFGKLRVKDITSEHLQAFINYLTAPGSRFDEKKDEPLSAATVKRYSTVFSSIMNEAFKMGLVEKDVLYKHYIEYPKIYKKHLQAYNIDEVKLFFAGLEHEPLKTRVLLYTSLLLGLRRGEVVGLMWSDFDFKNKCLHISRSAYKTKGERQAVKPPKSKSSVRVVYYSEHYMEVLILWGEEQKKEREAAGVRWNEQGFVFTNQDGDMISLYSLSRICSKYEEKCGLRHLKLHGLRHTCGSLMIQSGVDIETVRSLFGHESIKTTQQYLSAYDNSKKRAADLLTLQLLGKDEK